METLPATKLITPSMGSITVAQKAAEWYHKLRLSNQMIEFRDIIIAATCIVHELPVVTLNKKHFKRIDGFKILR